MPAIDRDPLFIALPKKGAAIRLGNPSLLRFWTPVAILAFALAFLPIPGVQAAPVERHFRLEAHSFEYQPSVLWVNPGDRVTLDVVARDVVHGIYLDGYDLQVIAEPGQVARLSFVADRPGSFRFRCPIACGALHPFMIGKLHVGPNWLQWRGAAIGLLLAAACLKAARS